MKLQQTDRQAVALTADIYRRSIHYINGTLHHFRKQELNIQNTIVIVNVDRWRAVVALDQINGLTMKIGLFVASY